MNKNYLFSKDLAMVFATLFLGTAFFQDLFNDKIAPIIWLFSTLMPTLISIVFMVIFRNEKQV